MAQKCWTLQSRNWHFISMSDTVAKLIGETGTHQLTLVACLGKRLPIPRQSSNPFLLFHQNSFSQTQGLKYHFKKSQFSNHFQATCICIKLPSNRWYLIFRRAWKSWKSFWCEAMKFDETPCTHHRLFLAKGLAQNRKELVIIETLQ